MSVCPNCGRSLVPVALDPQSAPWMCPSAGGCGRGWWAREIAPDAASAWRSAQHDFGFGVFAQTLRRDVKAEHAAAHERGVSVREDQLPLLDPAALAALLAVWGPRVDAAFLALVQAAVKAL